MTTILEINDIAELKPWRADWRRLLESTPEADFFRTLDWLEVYWRHFGEDQNLRVLLMLEDDELVGVLPLTERTERTKAGPFRVLTYPLQDWGALYGPVGSDVGRILHAGLRHVADTHREWDIVELRWVDAEEKNAELTERALREAGLPPAPAMSHTLIPRADLRDGWESYWSGRSSNWRSNCRRNEKKVHNLGDVEHISYRPRGKDQGEDDPRWDLYDACEAIAAKSWQADSQDGVTISHPRVRPFMRDLHVAAAGAGCLEMNLLRVAGRPVAFNYNYVFQGRCSNLRLGYDPELRNQGVGTVLTYLTLRKCFERGDWLFDFLPGALDAKRPWQTAIAHSNRYTHYPASLGRHQLLRMKRWFNRRFSETVSP